MSAMTFDCRVELRENPVQHKKLVRIGCGAGFAGDRPSAALKLLKKVPSLDYLVLECLAERTLAIRHETMMEGGKGYDPRISEWMQLLLPEAVKSQICIITNMGATDAEGAQEVVLQIGKQCGLIVTVGVIAEVFPNMEGSKPGSSTYLGAGSIVKLLETSKPNVIITSRLADASLFLGPMVYELGWNWNDFEKLAQGTVAGHLLECGCQVTGGYFAHPADEYRDLATQQLLDVSLPYTEVTETGEVMIAKPTESGGELSLRTCSQQLLYEVGDPSAYITPDVVVDFTTVTFKELSEHQVAVTGALPGSCLRPENLLCLIPQECGWKAWGEISYGGIACIQRAQMAELLVRAWMEESFPNSTKFVMSYIIGMDSLCIQLHSTEERNDIRLRMDGIFDYQDQAERFTHEFEALYTNGPAGGGGISVGYKKNLYLSTSLVPRENTFWRMNIKREGLLETLQPKNTSSKISAKAKDSSQDVPDKPPCHITIPLSTVATAHTCKPSLPAPRNVELPLYKVAHCRAGDKGDTVNLSIIPHHWDDLRPLTSVITVEWIKRVMGHLFRYGETNASIFNKRNELSDTAHKQDNGIEVAIYVAQGIHAMNIVVKNALDGGVNCSRRIDRHGKSLSDLLLCQILVLPH